MSDKRQEMISYSKDFLQRATFTLPENLKDRASISPKEFSVLTGVSIASAYRYLESGELKHYRLGGRILIPLSELYSILEGGNHE